MSRKKADSRKHHKKQITNGAVRMATSSSVSFKTADPNILLILALYTEGSKA